MTRLQKKCLAGAVCFHGLIVVVLLATAAFRSEPSITEPHLLNLVNLSAPIVDRPDTGGTPVPAAAIPKPASPAVHPAPSAPPETHPRPNPTEPPKTAVKTPPKQAAVKPASAKPAAEPAPTKRGTATAVSTSAKPPPKTADSSAHEKAAAQAAAQTAARETARKEAQEIARSFAALDSTLSSKDPRDKVVLLPGEGGGEAFVNYRTAIFNAYYQAWKNPEDTTHSLAVADVEIVVARNGDILSSKFLKKSGDPSVDQSVQRALDQVERQGLPPFPPSAEDSQRTFIIRFNLEAKQSAG
jgi:outer membrane biosynthesis protein TonB